MNGRESKRAYGVKLVRGPFVRLPRHPDACDSEQDLQRLMQRAPKRPLAVDLFCGAGGLSLGLRDAGFEVVLGVDTDEEALETHRAHHPGMSVAWDLADPVVIERVSEIVTAGGVTLLAGGPPCQPFSRAGRSMIRDLVRTGRRQKNDRRRDLWISFLEVVARSRPPAVLMENVPDMALDRNMMILRTMVDVLEDLGYSVEERVVDTWRYGVPQFRQRLIMVGLLERPAFEWPAEDPTIQSVRNAIGDLPEVDGGWRPDGGAEGWAPYEIPRTSFQRRARERVPEADIGKIFDHITRPVREDDAVAFNKMDSTTRYSDLDPELKRYRDDIFDDKYKRLDYNGLSRTITAHIAKDGYWYIHPEQARTLTVREAARLQTFRDDVRFAGPPSAAFRQIGNAVPPLLGERIGVAILSSLSTRKSRRGLATPVSSSTIAVASGLASWFRRELRSADRDPGRTLRVPWLAAETRWVVIAGEVLWSRLSDADLPGAWSAVRNLHTPAATLDSANLAVLGELAAAYGRGHRLPALVEAARWFVEHPDSLRAEAPATEMAVAPNVTAATADLAARVVPGGDEDPVLATYGVLRVAARFSGVNVDRQNKLSDGRLAVARMVGAGRDAHYAHLALVELANGVCPPEERVSGAGSALCSTGV